MLKKYRIVTKTYDDIVGVERGWITHPGHKTGFLMGLHLTEIKDRFKYDNILIKEIKDNQNDNKSYT